MRIAIRNFAEAKPQNIAERRYACCASISIIMKVFIKEYCRDVIVRIYGIDGEERTKEYFDKYLATIEGVYPTTDEEHESYKSEAVYTITKADYYNFFAQQIENIQKGIDEISEALFRNETEQEYTFEDECYAI